MASDHQPHPHHHEHRWRMFAIAFFASGLTLLLVLLFADTGAQGSPSDPNFGHKVTICHATSSSSNPFTENTVDVASSGLQGGHENHDGDIIPPFTYVDKDDVTNVYLGKNMTTDFDGTSGAALLANHCEQPTPPPTDVCPNIDGVQTTIPDGMIKNDAGDCVRPTEPPTDVCPNIDGVQTTVPDGYVLNNAGECVKPTEPPADVCPNIDGVQDGVPDGYYVNGDGDCVQQEEPPADVCPNIEGPQDTVPEGMFINDDGECVAPDGPGGDTDVCVNIDGVQTTVPEGMELVDGACLTADAPGGGGTDTDTDGAGDTPTAGETERPTTVKITVKATTTPDELPFTGAEQNALVGLGIALLVLGVLIEVANRRRHGKA